MATCVVSGIIKDASETAIASVPVKARITTPYFTSTTIMIAPKEVSTTTDGTGLWSLTLNQGAQCLVTIEWPPNNTDSAKKSVYTITVPATSTANFSSLATEL